MSGYKIIDDTVTCMRCNEVFTDESTWIAHKESDHGDKEENFKEVVETFTDSMNFGLSLNLLNQAKKELHETNMQELYHGRPFKNPKAKIPTKLEPHNSADDLVAGVNGYNDDPNSFFYNNKNFKKANSNTRTGSLGEAIAIEGYDLEATDYDLKSMSKIDLKTLRQDLSNRYLVPEVQTWTQRTKLQGLIEAELDSRVGEARRKAKESDAEAEFWWDGMTPDQRYELQSGFGIRFGSILGAGDTDKSWHELDQETRDMFLTKFTNDIIESQTDEPYERLVASQLDDNHAMTGVKAWDPASVWESRKANEVPYVSHTQYGTGDDAEITDATWQCPECGKKIEEIFGGPGGDNGIVNHLINDHGYSNDDAEAKSYNDNWSYWNESLKALNESDLADDGTLTVDNNDDLKELHDRLVNKPVEESYAKEDRYDNHTHEWLVGEGPDGVPDEYCKICGTIKQGEAETSNYEVDVDEYLKTGEPVEKREPTSHMRSEPVEKRKPTSHMRSESLDDGNYTGEDGVDRNFKELENDDRIKGDDEKTRYSKDQIKYMASTINEANNPDGTANSKYPRLHNKDALDYSEGETDEEKQHQGFSYQSGLEADKVETGWAEPYYKDGWLGKEPKKDESDEADNYKQKPHMTDNEWEKDLGDLKTRYETESEDVIYDQLGSVEMQGKETPLVDIPILNEVNFGYESYEQYPVKASEGVEKKEKSYYTETYSGIVDEYDRFQANESDDVSELVTSRKMQGYNSESIAKELVIEYGVSKDDALEKVYSIEVSVNDQIANTFFQKRYSECNPSEIEELKLYAGSDE